MIAPINMSLEVFSEVLDDGYKGALVLFLCVISYKLYRMKITSESNCCPGFKLTTSNEGGGDEV